MADDRIQLNDEQVEDIVGGNFNWVTMNGQILCKVDGVGKYYATDTAKNTFAWLKMEHRYDGWTDADYVNELVSKGEFSPM